MHSLIFNTNKTLSEFSTLGVGGPISYFVEVKSFDEMREGLLFASKKSLPFFILGKGSNCLFSDKGFTGVVLLNKIDFCNWGESSVHVGAGYSFSLLGSQSARKGFCGLEFASGIPASVGGAIFMNAGANGTETQDLLKSVTFIDPDGRIQEYDKKELHFSYRNSCFHSMPGAILSAIFTFSEKGPHARQKQLEIIDYRKKTQPLKEKSIGCIFRNPPSQSAGALIEQCALKGLRKGGAKVSEMHANFIINSGNASAKEVTQLILEIQKTVHEKTGIVLEPEVRLIP